MRRLLLATMLWLVPAVAEAQPAYTGQVAVSAAIPVASPTGAGTRGLGFGVITPDPAQATTVQVIAAANPASVGVQAGAYQFAMATTRGISFTVNTPSFLTAGSLPPLPVSFAGTEYGSWCITVGGSACTLASFDPVAGIQLVCAQKLGNGNCHRSRTFQAGSYLNVYIGGELIIPPMARAATYTATITLTITQVH